MSNAIRQVINIANSDLTILEHKGKRVVTLAMVDQVHQRPAGTAKRNFHENRSRFEEGKHYFLVPRACADEFRTLGVEIPNRGLTVLTQRGYLLLVKSFTDELSWQVQDMLVDGYFEGQRQATQPSSSRIANHRLRLSLAKELYRTRDRELRQLIHQQLADVSNALGLPVPELDNIGRSAPKAPDVVKEFWKALAFLDGKGVDYNHACTGNLLAVNLPQLADLLIEHGYPLRFDRELYQGLEESESPRCLHKNHAVNSRITGKTTRCWVFERPAE